MELPDFNDFEPFNKLRNKMGATKLGYFELFDPRFHLTGVERSDLEQQGKIVNVNTLHQLLDFTLVYKNTRIWLETSSCYHLASCKLLPIANSEVHIGTSLKALTKTVPVCKACLQKLQYQGFDDQKARKEVYSQQVFEKFNLAAFWIQFHLYPVSEKRELRKSLGN